MFRDWVRVRYRFRVENHTHTDKRTLKHTKKIKTRKETFTYTCAHIHTQIMTYGRVHACTSAYARTHMPTLIHRGDRGQL